MIVRPPFEATELAAERQRADKAIAAFAALAERLDALAVAHSRPWWGRLVGWEPPSCPHLRTKFSATCQRRRAHAREGRRRHRNPLTLATS
jgi:hypothetical protein